MSSLNSVAKSRFDTSTTNVVNKAGAPAFKYPEKLELILRCTSNFNEDNYYCNKNEVNNAITKLVNKIGKTDPVYIMKLASWLRNDMNMRTMSIYLFALMAGHKDYDNQPKPWLIKYGPSIMLRADEPAEALATFKHLYPGDKIPKALLKAISARLNKLTAYEAIKYQTKNKEWSLKDVIRVSHPKPDSYASSYLFDWIVNDNATIEGANEVGLLQLSSYLSIKKAKDFSEVDVSLLNGATWELLVSKFGSLPEVWRTASRVMPSMAYIRNLRNLLNKTDNMILNYEKIEKAGENKKMFPFRFLSAKLELDKIEDYFSETVKETKKSLEKAIESSVSNVPNFGNVALLVDHSGSMFHRISEKSNITLTDIADVFSASVFKRADNAVIINYGSYAEVVKGIDKSDRLFSIIDKSKGDLGGTNLPEALKLAENYLKDIDLIYILTDEQSWMNFYDNYKTYYASDLFGKMFAKKPSLKVINHNLCNYGTSELPEDPRILNLGGWSDNVFNVVNSWKNSDLSEFVEKWEPDSYFDENE